MYYLKKECQKRLYKNYLKKNDTYFKKPYNAPNVESFVFRFYVYHLVHDFNITGRRKEEILDFGSGRGGNLNFFHKLGFNIFGADIAKKDIKIAKKYFLLRKIILKLLIQNQMRILNFSEIRNLM